MNRWQQTAELFVDRFNTSHGIKWGIAERGVSISGSFQEGLRPRTRVLTPPRSDVSSRTDCARNNRSLAATSSSTWATAAGKVSSGWRSTTAATSTGATLRALFHRAAESIGVTIRIGGLLAAGVVGVRTGLTTRRTCAADIDLGNDGFDGLGDDRRVGGIQPDDPDGGTGLSRPIVERLDQILNLTVQRVATRNDQMTRASIDSDREFDRRLFATTASTAAARPRHQHGDGIESLVRISTSGRIGGDRVFEHALHDPDDFIDVGMFDGNGSRHAGSQ